MVFDMVVKLKKQIFVLDVLDSGHQPEQPERTSAVFDFTITYYSNVLIYIIIIFTVIPYKKVERGRCSLGHCK